MNKVAEKYIPKNIEENYTYMETYIAGATQEIPCGFEISFFKHNTEEGFYVATEPKTAMVEYKERLHDDYYLRQWMASYHDIFTHSPYEVERRLKRNGLNMNGEKIHPDVKNHTSAETTMKYYKSIK